MPRLDSQEILDHIKKKVKKSLDKVGPIDKPVLGLIVNEDDKKLKNHAKNIADICNEIGIGTIFAYINSNTPESFIIKVIEDFNEMEDITAVIMQCPFPIGFRRSNSKFLNKISPNKKINYPIHLLNMDYTWYSTMLVQIFAKWEIKNKEETK